MATYSLSDYTKLFLKHVAKDRAPLFAHYPPIPFDLSRKFKTVREQMDAVIEATEAHEQGLERVTHNI